MAYHYIIQLASYEESEDPEELFVKEDDFELVRQNLAGDPSFAPWSSAFTYQDGRIDFRAGRWSPEQSGITQAACLLARRLNARVFGEDDEEYPTEIAIAPQS